MADNETAISRGHSRARWFVLRPSFWLRRGRLSGEKPGSAPSKTSTRDPAPPPIAVNNNKSVFAEIQAAIALGEETPPASSNPLTRHSYFKLPLLSRPPTYEVGDGADQLQRLKVDRKGLKNSDKPGCSTPNAARQSTGSPGISPATEGNNGNAPADAASARHEPDGFAQFEQTSTPPSGTNEKWETQMVPVHEIGPRKTAWAFHKALICVLPSKAKVPLAAERSWCDEIRDRLWHDLEPARRRISRKCSSSALSSNSAIVELELRMSGYVKDGADAVECSPTIWILCGSSLCKRFIDKAVEKMTWLHDLSLSVEVHVGASMYAVTDRAAATVSLSHLHLKYPITLPDGRKLYIHIEDQTKKFSASGRLICATVVEEDNSTLVGQRISRLGGFIKVDKHSRFGVTTAHGIADYLAPQPTSTDPCCGGGIDSDSDTESLLDPLEEPAGCCGTVSELTSEDARLGYKNPAEVALWMPVSSTGTINFLGQGAEAMASGAAWWSRLRVGKERFQAQADFALLANIEDHFQTSNRYLTSNRIPCNISNVKASIYAGAVHILADGQSPISALLLAQENHIHVRSDGLQTRRIQTELPLVPGVSGSWVVRDDTLCGMIVAIHEREPFAHIIEAWRLFSDIQISSPGAQTVELSDVDDNVSNKSEVVKLSVIPSVPEPEPEPKLRAKIGRQGSTVTITISPEIPPVLDTKPVDAESKIELLGEGRMHYNRPEPHIPTSADFGTGPKRGTSVKQWASRLARMRSRLRLG